MKIKFWGCRGSIPVPDARMMTYGGNTTCVEVTIANRTLILDAGTGIRKLGESLIERGALDIDLFLSHSHWDHIQGFPFFEPIYLPHTRIHILGRTSAYKQFKNVLASQMSYEYFPVNFHDLRSTITFGDPNRSFHETDDYSIVFLQANHPQFTLGARIEDGRHSFVFLTDNELDAVSPPTDYEKFVAFCRGADYLIHDAQFTKEEYKNRRGWGHSAVESVIKLARDSGAKHLGLFHHDPNRKDDELEALEKHYKKENPDLDVFAVKELSALSPES